MKKNIFLLFYIALIGIDCKQNQKKDQDSAFFPVLSFLNSQVRQVDTSMDPLLKIVTVDSVSDSTFINRKEFRNLANDFLRIPDLSEKKFRKKYKEDKLFDESLNKVILSYTPTREDQEIIREDVIIAPGDSNQDQVKSIIIETMMDTNDSTILKRLLWQVNESFQVVTTIEKPNQPDKIRAVKVVWNVKE